MSEIIAPPGFSEQILGISKSKDPEEALKIFMASGQNSDLQAGGALNEEQQEAFFWFVRAYSVMLAPYVDNLGAYPLNSPIGQSLRQRQMMSNGSQIGLTPTLVPGNARMVTHSNGRTSGKYDSAWISEPITRGATEATADADQYSQNPAKLGQRQYETLKYRSSHGYSSEFIMKNLRRGRLNAELGAGLGKRLGTDFELLAVQGDSARAPFIGADGKETPRSRLLRANDGWLKISRAQCPKTSNGGEYIEFATFMKALRSVPEEAVAEGYKWWMNPRLWIDWIEFLSNRAGGSTEASQALGGQGVAPMGLPVVLVPALPRDLAISIMEAATSGRVISDRQGPFHFPIDAFQIGVNIDGAGAETIVFPNLGDANVENRTLSTDRVCALINSQYAAARGNQYLSIARPGQYGRVEIVSPTSGAASSVAITAPANSALAVLGINVQTSTGEAADGAGVGNNTLNEGTCMWLSPDFNFAWHVNTSMDGSDSTGLRVFTKFDQSSDKFLFDLYAMQDVTIEQPEFTHVVEDIRVAAFDASAINP